MLLMLKVAIFISRTAIRSASICNFLEGLIHVVGFSCAYVLGTVDKVAGATHGHEVPRT
jgi:hypothetical protein